MTIGRLAAMKSNLEDLWDFKATLKYLRVDSRTLQRYVAENQLDSALIGGRRYFEPSAVKAFKKVVDARKRKIEPKSNRS